MDALRAAPRLARFALTHEPEGRGAPVPGPARSVQRPVDLAPPLRVRVGLARPGQHRPEILRRLAQRRRPRDVQRRDAQLPPGPPRGPRSRDGRAGPDGHPPRAAALGPDGRSREPPDGDGRRTPGPARRCRGPAPGGAHLHRRDESASARARRRPAGRPRRGSAAGRAVGARAAPTGASTSTSICRPSTTPSSRTFPARRCRSTAVARVSRTDTCWARCSSAAASTSR